MVHIFALIITANGGANTNVIYEMESLFEALDNRSRPDLMYRQRWLPFNSGILWARNMSKDTLVVPDIRLNYTWPILFVPCNTERVQYIGPESHQNRRYFMHSYIHFRFISPTHICMSHILQACWNVAAWIFENICPWYGSFLPFVTSSWSSLDNGISKRNFTSPFKKVQ